MNGAEAIAEFIAEKGITHTFGIIGAGNAALFDAIARLGKTEIICCHHEAAAAMAATYYGRAKGQCGVCIVTTGAGSSNAITGALAANMDSAPLLVISGNEPSRYVDSLNRIVGVQGFRAARCVESIVKESWHAFYPTPDTLEDAYATAVRPRSGTVWLDIARDDFNAMV